MSFCKNAMVWGVPSTKNQRMRPYQVKTLAKNALQTRNVDALTLAVEQLLKLVALSPVEREALDIYHDVQGKGTGPFAAVKFLSEKTGISIAMAKKLMDALAA